MESFLMELMIAVAFFILCASVCVLAFVKADHMSRLASDRNEAILAAESIAEIWKRTGMDGAEGMRTIFEKEYPEFHAELQHTSDKNGMETVFIRFVRKKDQEELFELQAGRYVRTENEEKTK